MKQKFANALSLALIVAMLFTSAALADNVTNEVDVDTFTIGGSTIAKYKIVGTGGDDQAGCNASDGSPASVTINVPTGVTATPGSLTFTACNTFQNVTFTSSSAGDYLITVSVSDSGTGSYSTGPAAFTLKVLGPADSTPPSITPNVAGTLGNNGWYTSDVTVSWTVVDNESSISSTSGCDPTTINTDTAGITLTCSATSAGGTNSQSVTIKRDATAPTISGSASPAPNGAGWNNSDVDVDFTCADNLSGIASCGPDASLTSEAADQSASGTAVDNAGNGASATVSGINIDMTAPVVTATASPAPNANGWNKTDVTVSFSGTDGLSGIASCDPNVVLSSEGVGQSATGSCVDQAGNSASATASNIKIDKTAPSVALAGGPANGVSYYFGSVPAAPTCSASDALSGLAGECSVSGYSAAVGTHTVIASASDNAGNSASASATYTVLAWTINGFYQPVDMGILNNVKGGSTVPLKFEVFAGPTELTNTSIVSAFTQKISCAAGTGDDIEQYATGSTSLRYDTTGGQFIFNWQTPKAAGACYRVTLTTQDGTSISADFRLK